MMQKQTISRRVRFRNFFRNLFRIEFLERRLAQLTLGKSPGHFYSKFVPNAYQYPPQSHRMVDRNGLKLNVDISDYMGHYLYFGFSDPSMNKLFELVGPNSNVIDVGTNIGWTFLNFAKMCAQGLVLGFEPDPENYAVCKHNLELNTLTNAVLLPVGLGAQQAELKMQVRTTSNRGGNRISPASEMGSVVVRVKRLDEVTELGTWSKIDLIKIDVEGYELHVLKGAQSTLMIHRPVLFVEVDDNNLRDQGYSASELVAFLSQLGYRIQHAETAQSITPTSNFMNCHFDVIARISHGS